MFQETHSVHDKVHKMIIARTNYTKTQNEPTIIKTVHFTDVNEIPPETSPIAGISSGMTSSASIHKGTPAKNIVKNTNENKLCYILNSQLNTYT